MSEPMIGRDGRSMRNIGVRRAGTTDAPRFWAHGYLEDAGVRYRTSMGEFERVDMGPALRWTDNETPPPG